VLGTDDRVFARFNGGRGPWVELCFGDLVHNGRIVGKEAFDAYFPGMALPCG
jgi:hypothetical protein